MNMSSSSSSSSKDEATMDAGAPLPDFSNPGISLTTVAPALGVAGGAGTPDYLEYDHQGRGMIVTMFANSGVSYLMGTSFGGLYGIRQGLLQAPSSRFRIQVNSVLNHCGRYGSRYGNRLGVISVLYSFYEAMADNYNVDDHMARHVSRDLPPMAPLLAGGFTGATYFISAGPRVAALAGTLGVGMVGATYASYFLLGIPYASRGYLFF